MRRLFRVGLYISLMLACGGGLSLFGGGFVAADEVEERREQLRRDLAALEREIEAQQTLLEGKQRERVSLERDVAILDAQIQKARLSIRARDLVIAQLTDNIGVKQSTIGSLSEKLIREKESLAQIIRRTNEADDTSMVEVLLSNEDLGEFFQNVDTLTNIKTSLRKSFYEIEDTKATTQEEKAALEEKRREEQELRKIQELQKQRIEEREREKQGILAATKGQEAAYQEIIDQKERTAAEIRAELFTLRDSAAIPFGDALELAERAATAVGVRPAFLLGIIAEESNLGENVGTGVWRIDMHPTRDRPVFAAMASELGFDPDEMPVSKKPWYGWGGAMGPAQFIPSTWVCYGGFINTRTGDCNNAARSLSWDDFWQGPWVYRANEDRIRTALKSNRPANPWANLDAFTASAALLADNGADRGTYAAERLAALRYFAGWANAEKPSYAFYGDDVMALAEKYQQQIDILKAN